MRITKKEIRQMVPEEDYERGLAYYEQDRVISYREEVTKDLAKLTCKVRGTKLYTVNASFSDRGLSALCTCPRLQRRFLLQNDGYTDYIRIGVSRCFLHIFHFFQLCFQ